MFVKLIGALVSIPLFFFAPGYFLVRGRLFRDREMPWVEKLLLVLAFSASVTSLTALLLAEAGFLRIWLLDLVLAAVALLVRLLSGRGDAAVFSPAPRRKELAAMLLLAILAASLFFVPAEFVIGEGDPQYYYNIGYHLADSGSMNVYDNTVKGMSDEEIKTFYVDGIGQFFPFQLRDRATGKIQPLLYHLLPTWIGVFIMLFGAWGGLYVVPLFALLGMLALYALARRFAGVPGACLGTVLAVTFFLQVWFSRAPVSEIFCQFFILSSVLFFLRFLDGGDAAAALCSALALTAASLARPEAVLVAAPMLAVVLAELFRRGWQRGDYVFLDTLLAGLLCVLAYIRLCAFEYVSANFGKVIRLFGSRATLHTVIVACGILVVAGLVLVNIRPLHRRLARLGGRVGASLHTRGDIALRCFRTALALVTLATFIYLYHVGPDAAASMNSPQKIFVNTAVLFGGVTVFVFVLGLCLLVLEAGRTGAAFLLSTSVVVLAIAPQGSMLSLGQYPWDSRRLMLLVIPAFFLGFGYLANRIWRGGRPELRAVVILATAGFLALSASFLAPMLGHRDYRGSNAQMVDLARRMDESVVVFTDWYLAEVFGMPLRYQHGIDARKAVRLKNPQAFLEMVEKYSAEGKSVLIEKGGIEKAEIPYDGGLERLLIFRKAFEVKLTFPRLYPVFSGMPRKISTQEHEVTFYCVTAREGGP